MATDLNSRLILAKNIKMDRNYNNVLSYTEDEMLSLCQTNKVVEADNYSFIRTNQTILCGFNYEMCLQANYIAFQNPDYSNKWFFAWIDEVHYKGENNTEIVYTIDSWSTWYDYWTKKTCFINRQHATDDTIGSNTIPENLDVGEVVEEAVTEDASYGNAYGYWVAVASNWEIKDNSTGKELLEGDKGTQYAGITVYDNTVFGTKIFLIDIKNLSDFANLDLLISRTNMDGHVGDIENIFIVPKALIRLENLTQHTAKLGDNLTFNWYTTSYDMTPTKFNTEIDKLTSFKGYEPKNNKCFVYPYNYLYVSNNNGSGNIYKYENFSTEKCVFENQISISVGGSGRLVPKNYKGMPTSDDEALPLGKYPTCAWSSDAYTNWLTQNGVNMAVNAGMLAGGIAASVMTGGAAAPLAAMALAGANTDQQKQKIGLQQNLSNIQSGASMGLSVASSIGNTIGQFYSASLMPNISGGQATGDIIWAANRNCFSFRQMRVKNEYLMIIDDYFTRFGYAVKRLTMPNLTGRKYWNYVEIGDSEEIGYGDVPSNFMEIINNACRKGVTIWHNHSNLGNFNVSNDIV